MLFVEIKVYANIELIIIKNLIKLLKNNKIISPLEFRLKTPKPTKRETLLVLTGMCTALLMATYTSPIPITALD
jgi:hypothetical protein